jgi:hypothetical protein
MHTWWNQTVHHTPFCFMGNKSSDFPSPLDKKKVFLHRKTLMSVLHAYFKDKKLIKEIASWNG